MIVREATLNDAAAIAQVHVDTWRTTYRGTVPDDYLDQLSYEQRRQIWAGILSATSSDHFTYVAEDEIGQIVGFANGGLERTGNRLYQGELAAIYVLATHQGRGIGRRLVSVIVERLNQIDINSMLAWVLIGNSACQFYLALGGQQIAEKQVEIGGTFLDAVAYGWLNTAILK
jgi:GNAT superfamily N-acetyltransferase